MKNPWLLPTLLIALASWSGAQAPSPAPAETPKPAAEKPKPPAEREMPPDVQAFNDANKISDPEKKIAALQKFKSDFPKSSMLAAVDTDILSVLVKSFPAQTDRIRNMAKSITAGDPKTRGQREASVASQLLEASVLLKDARGYARKSVQAMNEAAYVQEQREGYAKRKQKGPSDEELRKRFRESRANRVGTLGRIEVKLGDVNNGRKLLEESYAVNANQPAVAAVLGELAAKAGSDSKALDYLVTARLSGKAPASSLAALDALYRKTHNGSLDGLDAMLDSEYHKRYPNPLHLEPFQPSEKRTDRVVLAEVFTGAGCPPCVAADLAFDAAAERYSRKDLTILMYHQHIPRPDPMTTLETTARFKFYDGRGVPTFAIDGAAKSGGGGRENTKDVYARFKPELEHELELPSEAHVSVGASLSGSKVNVKALVKDVKTESKDLRLQIVLAEKELRYSSENGVRFHPMVVRAIGGPKAEGFALTAQGGTFEQAFDLDQISAAIKNHLDDYEAGGHRGESFKFSEKKYEIAHNDLAVVVFVQDTKTRHVLQAGYLDLSVPGEHRITESEAGIGDGK